MSNIEVISLSERKRRDVIGNFHKKLLQLKQWEKRIEKESWNPFGKPSLILNV